MGGEDRGDQPARAAIQEVSTYCELEGYLKGFRDGHIGLLVLLGRPGVGKTEMAREILGAKSAWIMSGLTPMGMYGMLHRYRDKLVVLDDIDNLFRDPKTVALLKAVCQTRPVKRLEWNTRQSVLDKEELPPSFETTSRVLIIANGLRKADANVSAVTDRGIVVRFQPDAREVHARVGEWFEDKQIYDWFGARLDQIQGHSMRTYGNALSLKRSCIDWRFFLGHPPRPDRAAIIRELLTDETFASDHERAKVFEERGAGCKRTFYNWKKRIEDEAE